MRRYLVLSRICSIPFSLFVTVMPLFAASALGPTVLEAVHIERERQLWDTIKRADSEAFAALLAPEYLFVSGSGAYAKAATVKMMASLSFTEYTLDEFKVLPIGPDSVIVSYRASGTASFKQQEPYAFKERHGSVWVLRDEQWLCVYHHFSPLSVVRS